MMRFLPLLLAPFFPLALLAQPKLQLTDWSTSFNRPVDIAHCGDSRMFVVEQAGIIRTLDSNGVRLDVFLDIQGRVNDNANERGLLGLAFHPNYAQNGYFFVYYTDNNNGATQVSRFSVSADNPNKADPDSELFILSAAQPYNNHNGGCIKFGPDGYLYIGLGDGGSGGDPQNNGQKKATFLGKILRIDVNNSAPGAPYVVPADNPFVGQTDFLPEIWSFGWRNPWRFSFDRQTGDMWIADVGQNAREEVDFEPAGVGGRNYGWRCYEGGQAYNTNGCQGITSYTPPVFSYVNPSIGCSITGGFIYRGSIYTDMYGVYLNADYCSGRIWGTVQNADGTFTTTQLANLGDYEFSTFGEDKNGELYIALLSSGKIQKVKELCSPFQLGQGTIQSPVCAGSFSGLTEVLPSNPNGNVSYAWSNGQTTALNVYLNPGTYTVTATDALGCTRTAEYTIEQMGQNKPALAAEDTIVCAGEQAQLRVSGLAPGSEIRIFRNNEQVTTVPVSDTVFYIAVAPLSSSTYFVQVVDTCMLSSNTIQITVETAVEPEVTHLNDTLYSNPPCTICQWLLNNNPIPGATESFYAPTVSGIYELQVTSPNGCVYESSGVQVVISEASLPASVSEFKLTPNPTDGHLQLHLMLKSMEHMTISLADASHRQIFMQTRHSDHLDLPIDLSGLPSGAYVLTVEMAGGNIVRKVVKR